jgi:hypothetical protein
MADFSVRSDSVDVEQIMRQIRTRIREKRGADYTEAELQQLAGVKLEKFLDPRGVRSDMVAQFRAQRPVPPAPPNFEFGETTLFETHRGGLQALRKLLKPLLKLFFNPDRITSALHLQADINTQAEQRLRRLEEREPIYYELVHNLTVEVTRLGIEVHNLKMRVESLSSRMDFDERRARALETVVQYRPQPQRQPAAQGGANGQNARPAPGVPSSAAQSAAPDSAGQSGNSGAPGTSTTNGLPGEGGERRRRRRRRRRRPGQTLADGSQPAAAGALPDGAPVGDGSPADEPEDSYEGDGADSDDDSDGPDSSGQ